MAIDLNEIKRLRDLTGVGMTDAKKALEESSGDFDKALEAMRKKGLTKAEKKGEREAREGLIESYVHSGRIGVLVELNCETDFVTRTDDFKSLAHDLAMHIAASAPEYVSAEEIPAEVKLKITNEFKDKAASEGKPADMIDKIVEGQVKKYFAEKCLLDQPYVKNPDQTVGENIVVRRFCRLVLGEVV
jgi:elongation factor Ts